MSLGLAVLAWGALAPPMPEQTLLIGSPKLSASTLAELKRTLGSITDRDAAGFHRLELKAGVSAQEARELLKRRGVKFVFTTDALNIDPNSLPSVNRHIEYKEASAKLLGLKGEEAGVDFYEALRFYLRPRVDANGNLPHDQYRSAASHRDQMPPASMRGGIKQFDVNKVGVGATWQFQGPLNLDIPYQQYYGVPPISGRKNDVAYAASNPSVIYTASAGGGIWKTTNGGTSWVPLSDSWQFLHTSTVAVSPTDSNLVLAGTGDYVGFFSAQTFGIMRSTDGGSTWTNVGAAEMGNKIVSKIVFNPNNPNVVLATCGRGLVAGDIFRSTDGGATWTATTAQDGSWDDIDYAGVDITPGVKRVWACGGGTATGTKVAYSDDDGVTWTAVAKPALFDAVEQTMDVAGSRNDPDGVYIIGPVGQKVYKSANGGGTWTDITTGLGADWSQATYDVHMTCGNNAGTDVIYVGLISLHASDDGGTTWANIGLTAATNSKWHNDQHQMAMHPTNANEGIACGDGGLAKVVYNPSTNAATFTMLGATFGDTQFYAMALHPTNFNLVMGGTQDNSTPASRGNLASWDNLYAGDGGFCGFNRTTPGIHYTTSQQGNVYRYDTELDATPAGISPGGASEFVTPLAMGNTGYTDPFTVTGSKLKRYASNRWTASKTTLSSNATRVVVSQRNGQRMWTVHANGDLYMSTNNGSNLTKKDSTLPNFAIGSIVENPTTDYDVIVVMQTTDLTSGRAYRCTNINATTPVWTNISGSGATGLPSMPANAVAWDPYDTNIIYVGTDIGMFMTTNGGSTWANMNTLGLPNIHVNDLVISQGNAWLYAATFGRGIWRIALTP